MNKYGSLFQSSCGVHSLVRDAAHSSFTNKQSLEETLLTVFSKLMVVEDLPRTLYLMGTIRFILGQDCKNSVAY